MPGMSVLRGSNPSYSHHASCDSNDVLDSRRPLKLVRHTRRQDLVLQGCDAPIPESVHQLRIEKREGGEGLRVWERKRPDGQL